MRDNRMAGYTGKKRLQALLIVFVITLTFLSPASSLALGQGRRWTWTNPLPQGNTLRDVWANGPLDAWAVGDRGTILQYDGKRWHRRTGVTEEYLCGISGLANGEVWAVGKAGTILHYNGWRWREQESGTDSELMDIHALDEQHVWAVGDNHTILFYDGNSWSRQEDDDIMHETYMSVDASDARNVWVVGRYGSILRYDGSDWVRWLTIDGFRMADSLHSVSAADSHHVWALGRRSGVDRILFYDGFRWTSHCSHGHHLIDVCAVNSREVWFTGEGEIWCNNSRIGEWADHEQPINEWQAPPGRWCGLGPRIDPQRPPTDYLSIMVLDNQANDGWVVGYGGSIADFNRHGYRQAVRGIDITLRDVSAVDASHVWAVGDLGTIMFYRDKRRGWIRQNSRTNRRLSAVSALDERHVWAVGERGTIRFFDGQRWCSQESRTVNNLHGVFALDRNHVWAVGEQGTILSFNGVEWNVEVEELLGYWHSYFAVHASDARHVWAVGSHGLVSVSDGRGWAHSVLMDNHTNTLRDVLVRDDSSVWIVGDDNLIARYIAGSGWDQVRIPWWPLHDYLSILSLDDEDDTILLCGKSDLCNYDCRGILLSLGHNGNDPPVVETPPAAKPVLALDSPPGRREIWAVGDYMSILYSKW